MARQPIFDAHQRVFGYELLYRRGVDLGPGSMNDEDSARALANTLVEIGLHDLVGKARAFVNVTDEMILSGALEAFPRNRVILEILETVQPTEELLDSLGRLRDAGYTLALDDYVASEQTEPLLEFAEIVKVDISMYSSDELKLVVATLKQRGLRVLAERVETREEQGRCEAIGCELFQGFYLAKPQVVEGRALKSNHLALIRLLSRMHAPDLTFDELESIVASDVQLNLQLLKFVKSAYFGIPGKIDSIRKALLFVGINTLAAVATLLMMSRFSDKPAELVFTAMVRAKMAELIGERAGNEGDRHFTVGMLSVLDALLDVSMPDLIAQLPLAEEVEAALLDPSGEGELCRTLRVVLQYERGNFDRVDAEGVPIDVASEAYRMALRWATQTQLSLAA